MGICVLPNSLAHTFLAEQVGLPISYKCAHLALAHWAQLQELPKMEQVRYFSYDIW